MSSRIVIMFHGSHGSVQTIVLTNWPSVSMNVKKMQCASRLAHVTTILAFKSVRQVRINLALSVLSLKSKAF